MDSRMAGLRETWVRYSYKENKLSRGTSDTKAKQIARDASDDMNTLRQEIDLHNRTCEVCEGVTSIS
jgi:hypothetical protein